MNYLFDTLIDPLDSLFQAGCPKDPSKKIDLKDIQNRAKASPLPKALEKCVINIIRSFGVCTKQIILSQTKHTPSIAATGSLKDWNFGIIYFNDTLVKEMEQTITEKHLYRLVTILGFLVKGIFVGGEINRKQKSAQNGLMTSALTALAAGAAAFSCSLPFTAPLAAGIYLVSCVTGKIAKQRSYKAISRAHITSVDQYLTTHCITHSRSKIIEEGIKQLKEEQQKNLALRAQYLDAFSRITQQFPKNSAWARVDELARDVIEKQLISEHGDDLTRDYPPLAERIHSLESALKFLKIPSTSRKTLLHESSQSDI